MLYLGIDQHARLITISLRDQAGDVVQAQVSTQPVIAEVSAITRSSSASAARGSRRSSIRLTPWPSMSRRSWRIRSPSSSSRVRTSWLPWRDSRKPSPGRMLAGEWYSYTMEVI